MSLKTLGEFDKALLEGLKAEVGSFSYFQLLRLAHRFVRKAGLAREDVISVRPPLFSMQVSKKMLRLEYYTGYEEKLEIETNFLPMYGAYAAVPDKLNEDLIEYDSGANYAPRDFLDLFQNQLHRLYFDSLVLKNIPVNYVEFGDKSYLDAYQKLIGFDKKINEEIGLDVSKFNRLCFKKHRNLKGLKKIMQVFLQENNIDYPVKMSYFAKDIAEISPRTLTKLGSKSLGQNVVIGNMIAGNSSILRYDVEFRNFTDYFTLIYLGALEKLLKLNMWYLKFDYKYQFFFNIPKYADQVLLSNPRTHLGVSSWLLDKDAISFRSGEETSRAMPLSQNTYFESEMIKSKTKSFAKKNKNDEPKVRTERAEKKEKLEEDIINLEVLVKKKAELQLERVVFTATQILLSIEQAKTIEAKNAGLTLEDIDVNAYFMEDHITNKKERDERQEEATYNKNAKTATMGIITEDMLATGANAVETINKFATQQQVVISDELLNALAEGQISPEEVKTMTREQLAIKQPTAEQPVIIEAPKQLTSEQQAVETQEENTKENQEPQDDIDYFAGNNNEEEE